MIGHNNPAPSPADFEHEIATLAAEIGALDSVDAGNAPAVRDMIARGNAIAKKLEAARKEAKQPHMDAAKAVDDAFKPALAEIADALAVAKKALTAFLAAEEKRQQEAAAEARRKAEEAAKTAAAMADDEFVGGFAKEQADVAALEAKRMERDAQSAGNVVSASGLARAASLRTYRTAKVTDSAALVAHYAGRQDVIDAALKLANADIRASKGEITIPGVEIVEEKRVA